MTKIEEVARAIEDKLQEIGEEDIRAGLAFLRVPLVARAAIEALRVPSAEIHAIILDYDDMFTSPDELWQSLIDAILKEK